MRPVQRVSFLASALCRETHARVRASVEPFRATACILGHVQGNVSRRRGWIWQVSLAAAIGPAACGDPPEGLVEAPRAKVTVKFDFDHRPLPDVPLPNDIATRPDPLSPTGLRVNASMIAPTEMEMRVRRLVDQLDGWGLQQPISIPFTGPIDVQSVLDGHRDPDYDLSNDVLYLIDVDRDSPDFGRLYHLDVGNGNYPVALEDLHIYGPADPRAFTLSIPFEEADEDLDANGELTPGEVDANGNGKVDPAEDLNGNGYLDPPEDTDADGVLDEPNYLPGRTPGLDDFAGRSDALMTFYERESHTLMASPMIPLRERTTYAVVVTRRIEDLDGNPVGSPFDYINHTAQTDDLEALPEVLPDGLDLEDVAFAFSFTTQTAESGWVAIRDGLYGHGVQGHLGADFPPELEALYPLKDSKMRPGENPYLLYHENWSDLLTFLSSAFFGVDADSSQGKSLLQAHNYVDYHVMGKFVSPQLFEVQDDQGKRLPLDNQSWPQDLDVHPVYARPEDVPFWLVMPRKESSARGKGTHAPIMLLGHGYQSNRISETIGFAGYLAEFGIATLVIDNVHHGLALGPDEVDLLSGAMRSAGLAPTVDAILDNRAEDLDADGIADSGVQFWTSYLFHTRDVMRQSALDYMQLIRIIRSWDGEKRWGFDTGNGPDGIAGDFDGDGVVDIGKNSPIYAMGGSLGGIMSTILGGAEPELEAVIPIAGGGRLADVGQRSREGGVPEAVILRVMGAVYYAQLAEDGITRVYAHVTELNWGRSILIAELPGILPGDTLLGENQVNGELGCGYMLPVDGVTDEEGRIIRAQARIQVASDIGDETVIEIFRGPALDLESTECELADGDIEPIATVDRMQFEATFEGETYEPGPLEAFVEGLGLRRGNPEIRRFMGIGQLVIDPADPAVFARHFNQEPLRFPGTGQSVSTNALIVTTVGDMRVPASTGVTVGRAAGYIDYLQPDPRYEGTPYAGKTPNQILIDTYTTEAVNTYKRFTMAGKPDADGVHMDVENFSRGTDLWGDAIPRLDPPLRLVSDHDAAGKPLDGFSGAIFTYAVPEGQHGFALPGDQTDQAIDACRNEGRDDCDTLVGEVFDVGWYMFHTFGSFIKYHAQRNPLGEKCNTREQCNEIPPIPPVRDTSKLP